MTNLRNDPKLQEADRAFFRALNAVSGRRATFLALARAYENAVCAAQQATVKGGKVQPLTPRF